MATEKNQLELYFEFWLNELLEAGYVESYKREPFKILVTGKATHERYDFSKKTSHSILEFDLLKENYYTADYVVFWTLKAKEIFFNVIDTPVRIWCPFYAMVDADGKFVSITDVKPTSGAQIFAQNASTYIFPIVQKVIFEKYRIYVNKAIPIPLVSKGEIKSGNKTALFATTFVPKRYLMTDGGSQARSIKYRKQTLIEYVTYKVSEINKINARLAPVQQKLL